MTIQERYGLRIKLKPVFTSQDGSPIPLTQCWTSSRRSETSFKKSSIPNYQNPDDGFYRNRPL